MTRAIIEFTAVFIVTFAGVIIMCGVAAQPYGGGV
jgi:hypothetical protein